MSHSMTWPIRQCPLCLFLVLAVGSCTPDGEEKEGGAREAFGGFSQVALQGFPAADKSLAFVQLR